MQHIARLLLLLLLPYRISLFSIVPELLCQLRFAFLGTAFGKAICHTLLHVVHTHICMYVCARLVVWKEGTELALLLLHSNCYGTYNFVYVCALCAYDMCDTLVLKFIMWLRQTRKQDNRAEQNRTEQHAMQSQIHRDSHERSNKQTHTHTHAADNKMSASGRKRVRPLAIVYGWQHWRLCRVRAWHLEKRKHRDIFLNDAIWVDIFKVGERCAHRMLRIIPTWYMAASQSSKITLKH